MVNHKADVALLQETHSTPDDEKQWSDEWQGDIYYSHGQQNARGVCILTRVSHICHNVISDNLGRHVMIDLTVCDRRMTIVNIYAPNNDDSDFVRGIIDVIETSDNDDRIIAGDFNCVLNDIKDKKGGAAVHSNQNMKDLIVSYIEEADLVDVWRKQHPHDSQFTFHRKFRNQFVFSRLDYFLVSFGLSNLVESSLILPSILTDHSLIKITMCIDNKPRGPGMWKFNCSLLHDPDYVLNVKQAIQETLIIEEGVNAGLLWEAIKLRIRTDTISYSALKKRSKNNTLLALNRRMTRLEKQFQQNPSDDIEENIKLIKQDIDDILQEQINGIVMRSKCDWQEYGEKSSKFFLNLEKRNFNNKTIKRLRLSNGTITMEEKNILKELHSFYSKLYTTTHNIAPDFTELDDIILPILSNNEQQSCEGLLSENEILEVLKSCSNNKSPGTDGFSAEFYKFFWKDIKCYLTNALNFNYINNKLSITQREGLITLIPKKEKDTLLIKNWRPITLLNQDYKLATKAIAKRICSMLPKLIHSDQTGFLKNRYIGENIIRIINIMDHLDQNNEAGLLLSADFEKAFDCLEWGFVEYCLNKLNFGPSLIKWVNVFYKDITTQVSNNGWSSDIFRPTRGSRQGCPLSPYIFLICAELLACMLRQKVSIHGINIDNRSFLVSQYADDTIITIKYSEHILREIIEIFKIFAKVSGLKVNYDKSQIMPLGRIKHNYNKIVPECNFQWTEGPINSLGVVICHGTEDLIKLNYTKALKKMENILKIWGRRYLTLYGKVTIINTFVISQLVYLLSVLPSPSEEMLVRINKLLFEFVWNAKPDKVKRSSMKLPKEKGGVSVPDIVLKDQALKIVWVQRIMRAENTWNIMIQNKIPVNLELFWNMNFSIADTTNIITNITNPFIREVVMAWSKYNFYNPSNIHQIRNQIIWFNSHVRINNKPIYISELNDNNIAYIHQFFNETGDILSLDGFQLKYGIHINFLTYYSIVSAIPRRWKFEIKKNHTAIDVSMLHWPLRNVLKQSHSCRSIYNNLIEQSYSSIKPNGARKWNEWFPGGLPVEEWQNSFKWMYRSLKCTKIWIVQFKILHFITATREKLFQWNIVESDVCTFCNEQIETLPHLLVECEVVKLFWIDLQLWLYERTDILFDLNVHEIIIGFQDENLIMFNAVYLLAKKYILRCSYENNFPNLTAFKKFITQFLLVEKSIAMRNSKIIEFKNMWSCILPS
jgi:exonuclease III